MSLKASLGHTCTGPRTASALIDIAWRKAKNEGLTPLYCAEFRLSPFGAPRDHPVTFDASESYDPDGEIAEYVWDFGDGTTATGRRVEHVFPQRRQYQVTLTVIDDDGAENRTVRTVTVDGCDTCG